jgi:hypothetical protein
MTVAQHQHVRQFKMHPEGLGIERQSRSLTGIEENTIASNLYPHGKAVFANHAWIDVVVHQQGDVDLFDCHGT